MRGGVPVFRRSTWNGRSRRRAASVVAGGSPMRPAAYWVGPAWILPARKVAAGSTTAPAHGVAFDDQVIDGRLEHGQVGLAFNDGADRHAVQVAVGLAAGGAHGRA